MVSCICITHNRVSFLEDSIRLFNNQTYPKKELTILFENCESTKNYILNNLDKYNYLSISQYFKSASNLLLITPISETHVCTYHLDSEAHFSIEIGVFNTLNTTLANQFRVIKTDNYFLVKSVNDDQYLNFENGFEISTTISEISKWNLVHKTDNTLAISPFNDFEFESNIKSIGWECTTVSQAVNSTINFYELNVDQKISLGEKRNVAIAISKGEYICVWDDDDLYSSNRIELQKGYMEFSNKDACSLNREILKDNKNGTYYLSPPRMEGWENSLLCKKNTMGFYSNLPKREDTPLLHRLWNERKLAVMEAPEFYVYNIHPYNISGNGHFEEIFKWSTTISENDYNMLKKNDLETNTIS